MDFLKFVTNRNVFPFLVIILILLLVALSIYGVRSCCQSKGAILEISECNNDNGDEESYSWSNLLVEHSARNASSDAVNIKNCETACDLQKCRKKFLSTKDVKFSSNVEDVSYTTPSSSWKNIIHLREKANPFQWTDRWFGRKKQANIKFSIGDDLQDLEESSLDLLICKLDSLVLTFKSSDASRSSATSISSITIDNSVTDSERCLSLVTIK